MIESEEGLQPLAWTFIPDSHPVLISRCPFPGERGSCSLSLRGPRLSQAVTHCSSIMSGVPTNDLALFWGGLRAIEHRNIWPSPSRSLTSEQFMSESQTTILCPLGRSLSIGSLAPHTRFGFCSFLSDGARPRCAFEGLAPIGDHFGEVTFPKGIRVPLRPLKEGQAGRHWRNPASPALSD